MSVLCLGGWSSILPLIHLIFSSSEGIYIYMGTVYIYIYTCLQTYLYVWTVYRTVNIQYLLGAAQGHHSAWISAVQGHHSAWLNAVKGHHSAWLSTVQGHQSAWLSAEIWSCGRTTSPGCCTCRVTLCWQAVKAGECFFWPGKLNFVGFIHRILLLTLPGEFSNLLLLLIGASSNRKCECNFFVWKSDK